MAIWNGGNISGQLVVATRYMYESVDMAATAMMCAKHSRRLCLKDLGCSPMRHLTNLRVEKAARLLVSTDHKIESICEEVGYEYRSTFSNVFTKVFGVRPSVYRESTLA